MVSFWKLYSKFNLWLSLTNKINFSRKCNTVLNQATEDYHRVEKIFDTLSIENAQNDSIRQIRISYRLAILNVNLIIDSHSDNFKNVKNVKNVKGALGSITSALERISAALDCMDSFIQHLQRRLSGEYTSQSPKRSREESEGISSMGSSGDHHERHPAKRLKIVRSSETSTNAPGTEL